MLFNDLLLISTGTTTLQPRLDVTLGIIREVGNIPPSTFYVDKPLIMLRVRWFGREGIETMQDLIPMGS
jgi:hypothetical protein